MRVFLTFYAAAAWACSSARVAASMTGALRGLDRGRRGRLLAPLLGKALSRCLGASYVPRLGYGSMAQARAKYANPRPVAAAQEVDER